MRKTTTIAFTSLLLAFPMALSAQDAPTVIPLWTNGAPGFESRKDIPEAGTPSMLKSVDNPSLTVFLPPKEKANGAAMVVCPGGGFYQLTFADEGAAPAKFLNSNGVAAFVLKYRLPRVAGSVYTMAHPREDGLRAMRLVRGRAGQWGLDTNRIGMMGFSAGGEVVSMTAFGDTQGLAGAPDPLDQVSARPDFVVEIYPGGGGIPQALPQNAPPAFLLVADDDNHTDSVFKLFSLYRAAKIPVEVHVFTQGAHAFGMGARSRFTSVREWPQRLEEWMGDNNILHPAAPSRGAR
ncbi:MAG: alpha/beta hydrolase [Verrucomicrobiota bacterium]|jgi:acetyl esterase/lipase